MRSSAETPAGTPAPSRAAAVTLPDTPAGQRAKAFLEAYNAADDAVARAFFAANFPAAALSRDPIDSRLARWKRFRADLGGLTLERVLHSEPLAIAVLVRPERDPGRLELAIQLEPEAPHLIGGVRLQPREPEEGEATPEQLEGNGPLLEPQAVAALSAEVKRLAGRDEFSGVVLAERRGRGLLEDAYGMADRPRGIPNRVSTRFNLGSVNKLFTRIAIAQLAEAGKISLAEHLVKYLPDYPNKSVAEAVTVAQLLDHSAGLGDIFNDRWQTMPKEKLRTLHDYFPLFVDQPLLFQPGAQQKYSNAGYVVLGAIVERVAGQDYFSYVRDHIFQPAGMTDSGWFTRGEGVPDRAVGYTYGDGPHDRPRHPNVQALPERGSSAGGGYATAPDLLRLSHALTAGKLLGPAYTEWIFTGGPQPSTQGAAATPLRGTIAIAGGDLGVNAFLEISADHGYTLVVLSNYDPPAAETVAKTAERLLARVTEPG